MRDCKPLSQCVGEYSSALGKHGPDSPETEAIRERYRLVPEFTDYADSLDRLRSRMRGERTYCTIKLTALDLVKIDELKAKLHPEANDASILRRALHALHKATFAGNSIVED